MPCFYPQVINESFQMMYFMSVDATVWKGNSLNVLFSHFPYDINLIISSRQACSAVVKKPLSNPLWGMWHFSDPSLRWAHSRDMLQKILIDSELNGCLSYIAFFLVYHFLITTLKLDLNQDTDHKKTNTIHHKIGLARGKSLVLWNT